MAADEYVGRMNNEVKEPGEARRIWPRIVLGGVFLGIILFVIWVWFAVQGVKRIKASSEGATATRGTNNLR